MSLTCVSCKVLFSMPQLHQEHYKSDWHRYNLKRRLAELPTLTKEAYEQRAAAFNEGSKDDDKKLSLRCESCNKHFSSQNALSNHLKSRKHLDVIAGQIDKPKQTASNPEASKKESTSEVIMASGDDDEEWSDDGEGSDWESCDDSDDEVKKIVVDTNDCLFCDHQSDSTEGNVSHMTVDHSFFIPDIEYLVDLDGLIATLAAKIHLDHLCLWCHGKGRGFRSLKSVRQHMLDKGHSKMLHEGDVLCDYANFYDYSSVESEKEAVDVTVIDELLEESDYELVLPSGATVGHRSLALYYKQNLKPLASDSQQKVKKVLQHYKALGYTGATGKAAVRKAHDIRYMQRMKNRYDLKLGLKQNKFQPHFRNQVMF